MRGRRVRIHADSEFVCGTELAAVRAKFAKGEIKKKNVATTGPV